MTKQKPNIKINDIFNDVEIEEIGYEGYAIFRVLNFPILVKYLLPSEKADIRIIDVNSKFATAEVIKLKSKSNHRVLEELYKNKNLDNMPLYIMNYSEQIKFKQKILNDLFKRNFDNWNYDIDFISAEENTHYRNKITLHCNFLEDEIKIGYYQNDTHNIFCDEENLLVDKKLNEFITFLIKDIKTKKDIWKEYKNIFSITFRFSKKFNEILVIFNSVGNKVIKKENLPIFNDEKIKIGYFINFYKNNKLEIIYSKHIIGIKHLNFQLNDSKYLVGPNCFFQINENQILKIYEKIKEILNLKSKEVLFDIFSGISSIGIYLSNYVNKIKSVEINEESVKYGKISSESNNLRNIEFVKQDATKFFKNLDKNKFLKNKNILILDPPRGGINKKMFNSIKDISFEKIIYLSCNPRTLVRDLKMFEQFGYQIRFVEGYDMFPQTYHIETVALLSKLNVDKHIDVEIKLDELDLTSAESKASYAQIKEYILEKFDLKVSTLYIAQIKKKCGIVLREHYNKSKKEKQVIPQCTPEKEDAIIDALRHFKMI